MLSIEADLPLAILNPEEAKTAPRSLGANLELLRSLNLLSISSGYDGGDLSRPDSTSELARLEAKIDVLFSMVASLLETRSTIPAKVPVQFNAEYVRAEMRQAPATDATLLALYPCVERVPQALYLPASLTSATHSGGHYSVELKIEPLDAALTEEIERYIFLRHRRELARKAV